MATKAEIIRAKTRAMRHVSEVFDDLLRESEATCEGLDVSHHQQPVLMDWRVLSARFRFLYARAAYGVKVDATYREHVSRARRHGVRCGPYLFYRQSKATIEQWAVFLSSLKDNYLQGDLAPCLDVEANTQWDGPVQPERFANECAWLLEQMVSQFGAAVLYISPAFWEELGREMFVGLPNVYLWIAHWNTPAPSTPIGMHWTIWQKGVIEAAGYAQPVDWNVASCSVDALPTVRL